MTVFIVLPYFCALESVKDIRIRIIIRDQTLTGSQLMRTTTIVHSNPDKWTFSYQMCRRTWVYAPKKRPLGHLKTGYDVSCEIGGVKIVFEQFRTKKDANMKYESFVGVNLMTRKRV